MPRPSLYAALNNRLYGPLIGRRDLTRDQWRDILRRALKASWRPAIITSLGMFLLIIAIKAAYYFSVTSLSVTPDMTVPQMQAVHDLLQLRLRWLAYAAACSFIIAPFAFTFLHRRLAAPHIRASANSLGLANVCTRCGHNLSGHTTTTPQSLPQERPPQVCPECGAPSSSCSSPPTSIGGAA